MQHERKRVAFSPLCFRFAPRSCHLCGREGFVCRVSSTLTNCSVLLRNHMRRFHFSFPTPSPPFLPRYVLKTHSPHLSERCVKIQTRIALGQIACDLALRTAVDDLFASGHSCIPPLLSRPLPFCLNPVV